MKPRLASSKKWTVFPTELTGQIQSIFEENFEKKLGEGKFIVEGRIYPEEILFRIGYLPESRLFQANFEASIDHVNLEHTREAIDKCIDATAAMMVDYYDSNENLDLPRNWKEFIFDGSKMYLQFSSVNTTLESLADKLLGLTEESLIHEEENTSEDYYDQ
jgi:hypothetical protein